MEEPSGEKEERGRERQNALRVESTGALCASAQERERERERVKRNEESSLFCFVCFVLFTRGLDGGFDTPSRLGSTHVPLSHGLGCG
eukprot:SAG11_NODE_36_length_21869_cov_38.038999_5_plen_87_part_00